ncbi:MAG TPA: hypothetical protein VLH59_04915 [Ignavibacteriaceae bacterium]|nr:hypothetical protein [Ignavibacteriaceae bacterium]
MNNKSTTIENMEKSLDRLRKSDKRLKLVLAAVIFIVSAATAMVIIASLNSM